MHHGTLSAGSRSRRTRTAAAAGAAALFAFTACGSEASSSGSGSDDEAPAGTSAEAPLHVGDTVELLGWEITVTGIELDATEEIMETSRAENALTDGVNNAPDPGHQLAMVTYEGTYVGDEEDNSFATDLLISFWIDGVEYDDCTNNYAPGLYFQYNAFDQGESATSAFCAQIPTDTADRALVHLTDWTPVSPKTAYYFAPE
jgi:hypothetical protein